MNYNEYRTYILTCEYLGREPTGQFKKINDFLTELWNDMEIVVDSNTNSIVFQKEGDWYFEQDNKNGYLWCHSDRVWSLFRNDMGMGTPNEPRVFHIQGVEEHLKCVVGTPFVVNTMITGVLRKQKRDSP